VEESNKFYKDNIKGKALNWDMFMMGPVTPNLSFFLRGRWFSS
jgi:hypothetical protein